ncbi:response regulator transcription factor [Citrobacter sp. JGM124]|uniref:response regulator transcription factor n=1 Tax=Citrobacter sp. JGM124 TaxID=2799789 RepID=UPI001BA5D9DB|nr:response regulator transcription factor [Citrobacter sp. JGM124]MBS0849790.1 response regulator transcription factor [Citrobacter sp. JGM124]
MKMLRIVLLDDHQVVLAGMKDFLDQIPNVRVEKTFSISTDLISYLRENKPDIVITDYNMPRDDTYQDGLKFVDFLLRSFPGMKLLVLTMISNPMIVSALYDAGVAGVIFKQDPLSEVQAALRIVSNNNKYYPPSFTKNTRRDKNEMSLQDRVNKLSPREYEVLRYFIAGESITQIAEKLNRSTKTVSLQKNSAMNKLNVESNQDLIRFCVDNNIFD